jgi:general stress protein CsbA
MNLQEIASASALIKQELEPLAQKIGQGVEWTFELFVRQAYVNAFTGLLWIVPGIILAVLAYKCFTEKWIVRSDGVSLLLGFIAGIMSLVLILFPISELIQVLVNPEFAAIKLIIETFKSVS